MKIHRAIASMMAVALVFPISNAQAVVKTIVVYPVKPISISKLSGGIDDEISGGVVNSKSIVLVGTVCGAGGQWVTSAALGGNDGFISSVDLTGGHLWDLRLGTSADDIATSVVKDKTGNYWVVGVSAPVALDSSSPSLTPSTLPAPSPSPLDSLSPLESPSPSPSATFPLNPDGVLVSPSAPVSPALTTLTLWQVGKNGQLLATYSNSLAGAVFPKSILFNGADFTIAGDRVQGDGDLATVTGFSVTVSPVGLFAAIHNAPASSSPSAELSVAAGTSIWKSFISTAPIPGLTKWAPKKPIPVLLQSAKSGKILDARYFSGKAILLLWQSTPGLVLLSEQKDGFGMTIVNPLAG